MKKKTITNILLILSFLFVFILVFSLNTLAWAALLLSIKWNNIIENILQLLSGLPIMMLIVVGVKFIKSISFPVIVLGIILLIITPISVPSGVNILLIKWNKPFDISGNEVIEHAIETKYLKGSNSAGNPSQPAKSDVFQVFLPLDNSFQILYEYRYPHQSALNNDYKKNSIEKALAEFRQTIPRYAIKPDKIYINGTSQFGKRHLENNSMIRVVVPSIKSYIYKNTLTLSLIAAIGALVLMTFLLFAIKKGRLEMI